MTEIDPAQLEHVTGGFDFGGLLSGVLQGAIQGGQSGGWKGAAQGALQGGLQGLSSLIPQLFQGGGAQTAQAAQGGPGGGQ
jgi:hypothetical protein